MPAQQTGDSDASQLRKIIIWIVTIVLLLIGIGLMVYGPTLTDKPDIELLLRHLGSFITVSIVIGFLYRVTVGPYDLAKSEERIKDLLYGEIDRMYSATSGYGFSGIDDSINFSNIFNNLKNNETLWWLDTYDPLHAQWIPDAENALKSGANIKMMIMNPSSSIVDLRCRELDSNRSIEAFKNGLTSFLCRMKELAEHYPRNIEIRLYNDLPCAPIYVVTVGEDPQPQRGFSSYFLVEATGIKFPHFAWRQGNQPFVKELFRYLQNKWNRASTDTG